MPQNREYPPKNRSAGGMKATYPSKSRGAGVGEGQPSGPPRRKGGDTGNKPNKGVLTSGGGHG